VANTFTTASDIPGLSSKWVRGNVYDVAASILHELRLTFLWPQLANGGVGSSRQTFRTMVAGHIAQINTNGQWLYFYQSQSFANAP
jgi:hypothetical protein